MKVLSSEERITSRTDTMYFDLFQEVLLIGLSSPYYIL